jgi:small subunit ribosomal protein S8
MSAPDPIGDMLTRTRNALRAGHEVVEMPSSRLRAEIVRLMKREGYVRDYAVEGDAKKVLRVYLKCDAEHRPVIRGLRRVSRPGLRKYAGAAAIPRVLGGLGITVMSTPQGIMTGREAKAKNLGGEVLCQVW